MSLIYVCKKCSNRSTVYKLNVYDNVWESFMEVISLYGNFTDSLFTIIFAFYVNGL